MREYHRRILGFLEREGCREITLIPAPGRGHPKVQFVHLGHRIRASIALSPSTMRASKRLLPETADVRIP